MILEVLLEIPEELAKRLATGELVRDAAGVIRNQQGHIVKHLQEISSTIMQDPSKIPIPAQPALAANALFGAAGVVVAVQAIGFLYLNSKLNRIEKTLNALQSNIQDLKNEIRTIQNTQFVCFVNPIEQAIEWFHSTSTDLSLLDTCYEKCIDARGTISNFVNNRHGEYFTSNLRETSYITRAIFTILSFECISMQQKGKTFDQINATIHRYEEFIRIMNKKINTYYTIARKRLPNSSTIKTLQNRASIQVICSEVIQGIEMINTQLPVLEATSQYTKEIPTDAKYILVEY